MRIPHRFRRPLKIAGTIVGIFLLGSLIDQCWQVRGLDADEFLEKAEEVSRINTTNAMSYVGTAGDRVYLQYWQMGRWSRILYWTSLRELPTDLQERLRAGDPPWQRHGERPRQRVSAE